MKEGASGWSQCLSFSHTHTLEQTTAVETTHNPVVPSSLKQLIAKLLGVRQFYKKPVQLMNETTTMLNWKTVLYSVGAVLMNFPYLTHSIESKAIKMIIKKGKCFCLIWSCVSHWFFSVGAGSSLHAFPKKWQAVVAVVGMPDLFFFFVFFWSQTRKHKSQH